MAGTYPAYPILAPTVVCADKLVVVQFTEERCALSHACMLFLYDTLKKSDVVSHCSSLAPSTSIGLTLWYETCWNHK